jgi:hypothetical protein
MKRVTRLGMVAVLAIGTVLTPAFAGDVTVGRFYTELARTKRFVSVDAASAEAGLRGAGFELPVLALDKPLTEGDVTAISTALGLAVTSQRPAQPISESQLNMFITVFGSRIAVPTAPGGDPLRTDGQGTGGIDPGNSGNGHGLKKGHNKSSSEPL